MDPKREQTSDSDNANDMPKILELLDEETKKNGGICPIPDRSTWIDASTEAMAAVHQENYEAKDFVVRFLERWKQFFL